MSQDFAQELNERLPGWEVPQAFFNGKHLGDLDTVIDLNENGHLKTLTKNMKPIELMDTGVCKQCGGEGFMICPDCSGNQKALRVRYGKTEHALKCTSCNENGLVVCGVCISAIQVKSPNK